MPNIAFALVLLLTVLAFMAAWRFTPAGWLTAATGSFGAVAIALYEAMADLMPELQTAMPAEYRPWLVVMFLLLTVAARFRNRAAGQ